VLVDQLLIQARQISVYFILPETKGVSLERMDKIFGEADAVEAGEERRNWEKAEVLELSTVEHRELAGEHGSASINKNSFRLA